MTPLSDSPCTLSDTPWQTVVTAVGGTTGLAIAGRWGAGATFGYVLFVVLWTPVVLCLILPDRPRRWGAGLVVGVTIGLLSPCLQWEPAAAVGRLAVTVAGAGLAIWALRSLLIGLVGGVAGTAVAAVAWMAWAVLPVTCPACFGTLLSESGFARLLAVHPVLTANAIATTAGDSTHQAVAYRWLTRLGQDVPLTWPASLWPCVFTHAAVALVCLATRLLLTRACSTWNADATRPNEAVYSGDN